MTEHSKYDKGFTAEDIVRYHSGKMSSLEMHRLEKAAMEDPFFGGRPGRLYTHHYAGGGYGIPANPAPVKNRERKTVAPKRLH